MMVHTYTLGDPREFMYFKGEYYINGSEVVLSDDYIATHTFNDKPLWKYARFCGKVTYNNRAAYYFQASQNDWHSFYRMGLDTNSRFDYAPYFVITVFELDGAIKEFSKPIKLSKEEIVERENVIEEFIKNPPKDSDYPELIVGWIVYIIVMAGSLIFNDFYLLWPIITFLFYKYRKGVIKQKNKTNIR